MAEQDEFPGFISTPPHPPQSHHLPHAHRHQINGQALHSADAGDNDDDEWGDFISPPQLTPIPFQSNPSNGFSHLQASVILPHRSKDLYPFGASQDNSATQVLPSTIREKLDSGPNKLVKLKGPLPLSLFGVDEEGGGGEEGSDLIADYPAKGLRNGANSDSGSDVGGIAGKLRNMDQRIQLGNGLGSKFNGSGPDSWKDADLGKEDGGIDDENGWAFKGAFFVSGAGDQAGTSLPGSRMEMITTHSKQDTSLVVENKPGFTPASYVFGDLFAVSDGRFNAPSVSNHGLEFRPTNVANDLMSVPSFGAVDVGKENGISSGSVDNYDDLDDFGDFVVAPSDTGRGFQEIVTLANIAEAHLSNGKEEQMVIPKDTSELNMLNGKLQDLPSKPEYGNGALPLSLFSDGIEDYDDNHQDVLIPGLASDPVIGIKNHDSSRSIHDLISTLYSEALSNGQVMHILPDTLPTESALQPFQTSDSRTENSDDDFDDESWEFKDASSESTVKQQLSNPKHGIAEKSSTESSKMVVSVDLYTKLQDELCFLVYEHLNDLKKAQSVDDISGKGGKVEDLDREIQEAYEMLQDGVIPEEVDVDEQLLRKHDLNEIFELLHAPEFQVLESEFFLLRQLQLAEKDWRSAIKLLKQVRSGLKVLNLASEKEQYAYLSTWDRILTVCVQELRHGASIWKQALEKNLCTEILSDLRGQTYIQALGEIYTVVEVIRVSAEIYKPWIVLNPGNQINIFLLLDECAVLWSHSGLEQSLQKLAEMVDNKRASTVRGLLESIESIHRIDVLSMPVMDFSDERSICQLTLLDEGILSGLKMVQWKERRYFLNVANLWANLISVDPPELSRLGG